ncbi:MAG TPA: hypothetical protein VMG41_06185 [Gemmatimonadales bacterium]|nr:hypothetical protein [Gemmatimonadales bacterium]
MTIPASGLSRATDNRMPVGDKARSLRTVTRVALGLALLSLGLVFAATRGWVRRETIGSSLLMFFGSAVAAVWFGFKAHQQSLADREREGRLAMIVAMAAQLAKQDEATLRAMIRKGGPAAESARMVLAGRQRTTRPAG